MDTAADLPLLRVLCLGSRVAAPSPARHARYEFLDGGRDADPEAWRRDHIDALLLCGASAAEIDELLRQPVVVQALPEIAVVVAAAGASPAAEAHWLERGVEAVTDAGEPAALDRALRHAVERKRLERATRTAFATDLATGLPNRAQLLEHMTQLLALREREPAPMALIVLRLEGLAGVAAALGETSAQVLRRKAAVRLRSGLRASDVVASIGDDSFAVLLAWIDAPADGARVLAKLAQSLAQPFALAGRSPALGVSAGLGSFPEHGKDAETLLRRALSQAASVATVGGGTLASAADRGPQAAANDEE